MHLWLDSLQRTQFSGSHVCTVTFRLSTLVSFSNTTSTSCRLKRAAFFGFVYSPAQFVSLQVFKFRDLLGPLLSLSLYFAPLKACVALLFTFADFGSFCSRLSLSCRLFRLLPSLHRLGFVPHKYSLLARYSL